MPIRTIPVVALLLILVADTGSLLDAADLKPVQPQGDTASPPTEAEMRAQVASLGAGEFRVRERAENALRQMGSTAIEVLQENTLNEDLEIRIRVQRLIGELRSRFIHEAVPEKLEAYFRRYEDQTFATRKARVAYLSKYTGKGRLMLLARLARFEESELLAKHAALALLQTDLEQHSGGLEAAKLEIRKGIELSHRIPSEWARTYVESFDGDLVDSVEACRKLIDEERSALQRFDKNTDEEIVRDLSRFLIRLMLRADMREEAIERVKSLFDQMKPSAGEAMELLDWLGEVDLPEVVEHFQENNDELVRGDAVILYRMAKVLKKQDKNAEAEKFAQEAYDSAGSGVSAHIARYENLMPISLKQQLLRAPDDINARRYAIAKILDDEIGLIDWAEKEYTAVIESPVEETDKKTGKALPMGRYQGLANIYFSEMLHDQVREKEAGERLQAVADALKKSPSELRTLLDRDLGGIESRMHYFFSCDAAMKEEHERERDHLDKALEADPEDVDVLIAMYRAADAPAEWKANAEKEVDDTIVRFEDGLRRARATLRNANNGRSTFERQVAALENQYAWLVGNTKGDIDAAIEASKHSLEVFPGEGGYLDTLGRCYYRKGDVESALEYQRQAVKAAPHEGQIRRQLELFESEAESQDGSG